jgi:hypothetical protein
MFIGRWDRPGLNPVQVHTTKRTIEGNIAELGVVGKGGSAPPTRTPDFGFVDTVCISA